MSYFNIGLTQVTQLLIRMVLLPTLCTLISEDILQIQSNVWEMKTLEQYITQRAAASRSQILTTGKLRQYTCYGIVPSTTPEDWRDTIPKIIIFWNGTHPTSGIGGGVPFQKIMIFFE
jgi:hypothetical protein